MQTSEIILFYNNQKLIGDQSFDDIVYKWSDEQWEASHNFIRWLFPTTVPSMFNSDAPLLTEEDIKVFQSDKILLNKLYNSLIRFLTFLGLKWEYLVKNEFTKGECFELVFSKNDNFEDRKKLWEKFNHNHLRITRCISSLKLLSPDLCREFFQSIKALKEEGYVIESSFEYWEEAYTQ